MKQAILTRILLLSAILGTTCLMASNAQAMGSSDSLNLQYEVLEGETLYAVATADGDLRFYNAGPGAVQVHWYDGLTGEKDQRILDPGKSLLNYGSLGAQVSEGTIVLVEQMGPGAISKGLASIPTNPQFRGCIPIDECLQGSLATDSSPFVLDWTCYGNEASAPGVYGAFLPWHRGYVLACDGKLESSPEDSILLLLGDEPQDFKGADLHNNGAFSPFVSLEHGPGMHDSVHCLVGGTMCSATVMDKAILWLAGKTKISPDQCQGACYVDSEGVIWGQTIGKSLEHGPGLHDSMYIDDASSNLGGQEGEPFMEPTGHVLWIILDGGALSLEHGPGIHDSEIWATEIGSSYTVVDASGPEGNFEAGSQVGCYLILTDDFWVAPSLEAAALQLASLNDRGENGDLHLAGKAWQECPPYEPCDDSDSIWSDGTFTSLSGGVLVVWIASPFLDGHAEEKPTYTGG